MKQEMTEEDKRLIAKYKAREMRIARREARELEAHENVKRVLKDYELFRTVELKQRKQLLSDEEQFAAWDAKRKAEGARRMVRFILLMVVMALGIACVLSSSGLVIF